MDSPEDLPMKVYVGYIWIGEQPGIRLNVSARSPQEARSAVEAQYGNGHVVSLWNEEDASHPRGA